MSLIDALDYLGRQYAGTTFGDPPPADVSDREADRWHDDGAEVLEDAMLRREWKTFRTGEMPYGTRRAVLERVVMDGRTILRGIGQNFVNAGIRVATWYRTARNQAMPRLYAGVMALIGTTDLMPADRKATRT